MNATCSALFAAHLRISFMNEQWATAKEACETLNLSKRTLIRWRKQGKLIPGIHYKHVRMRGLIFHIVYNVEAIARKIDHYAVNEFDGNEPRAHAP